jgi:hypothetical protein
MPVSSNQAAGEMDTILIVANLHLLWCRKTRHMPPSMIGKDSGTALANRKKKQKKASLS